VRGKGFVRLARLKYFVSRWACVIFVLESCFRFFLLGERMLPMARMSGPRGRVERSWLRAQ
jgi:hypothetical protein